MNNNTIKAAHVARRDKKDEFYTTLQDIEKEVKHYKQHFKNKTIFLNCDDPEESNFWKYFSLNFEYLGLKRLVATHFREDQPSYKLEIMCDINGDGKINGLDTIKTPLKQNGDFRSAESIEILKEADIVVTNPPFSLFRDYMQQLTTYNKKFLIIGSNMAIAGKEVSKLILEEKVWLGYGYNTAMEFRLPADYETWKRIDANGVKFGRVSNISWFTNLQHDKRNEEIVLFRKYKGNETKYPVYDNCNAIHVATVADIPVDYNGWMGVPITFMGKYNPKQFDIIRFRKGDDGKDLKIDGKTPFTRILIKRK